VDADGLPLKINRYFSQMLKGEYQTKSKDLSIPKWALDIHEKLMDVSLLYEYLHVHAMKLAKRGAYNRQMCAIPEFHEGYQFYIVQNHGEEEIFGEKDFRLKRLSWTEKYITALKESVEKDRKGFLMFLIPLEAQLKLKEYGYHTNLFFFGGTTHLFNERLNQLSKEKMIDFIDMTEKFQKHAEEDLYFHWDGHLTQAGHRVVANRLVSYFDDYFSPQDKP